MCRTLYGMTIANRLRLCVVAAAAFLTPGVAAADLCAEATSCRCGIRIVSYRIFGQPGQEITYDGDRFVIPRAGVIELIADRRENELLVGESRIILKRDERAMTECDQFAACRVSLILEGRP